MTLDQQNNPNDLVDEELVPYLSSTDDAKSQEQLHRLLDAAKPIVYRIARSMRMGATGTTATFNTQDIFGDVCVRLLQRLRLFKKSPDDHPISNFAGLVATTTTTVFSDLLRGQDRQRRSLSQKIRRLIAANDDLETWKDNQGKLVCGYRGWRSRTSNVDPVGPSQMQLDFRANRSSDANKPNTAELILLVLNNVRRPVRFDELVDLVNIAVAGVQVQTISIEDKHYVQSSPLVTYQPDMIAYVDNQRLLDRLFTEIQSLRVEQRKSLLLSMSDSFGYGIEWFLFTKIATEEHLARLLEVSIEQFRTLLTSLPMSDSEIALELGVSETKVKNIRKAVRARLARRRRDFLDNKTPDYVRIK